MLGVYKTKRLVLTKPSLSDLNDLFLLCSKKEVNIFNPEGEDKDSSQTKARLLKWIHDWEQNGVGYYIIRTRDTNAFVGYSGVTYRELKGKNILNLAYRIEPKFQRQGLTFEVCTFVLSKVNEPVMILTKNNNTPSINVAKKLSFVYNEKFDDYPDKGDVYYFNVEHHVSSQWIEEEDK